MGAVKGHFSFFTMLRLDIDEHDMMAMNQRFHLVPLVGLLFGIISGLGIYLLQTQVGMLAATAATLLCLQLFNRFLHMDGLMDVGDGLTVSGKREDHLRALKDTRTGAGGVAFAFFVTLLSFAGLASLPLYWLPFVPLSVEVLSRNTMVATAAFGSPGQGMAGESVRLTGIAGLFKSTILTTFLLLMSNAILWIVWSLFGLNRPDMATGVLALIIALSATLVLGWVLSRIAENNFGMVNGDMLGASNELSRAILLLLIPVVI